MFCSPEIHRGLLDMMESADQQAAKKTLLTDIIDMINTSCKGVKINAGEVVDTINGCLMSCATGVVECQGNGFIMK